MEHSIYFSLTLILMLFALGILTILIYILNEIRKELTSIKEKLGPFSFNFGTSGTFTATIVNKLIDKNKCKMDKETGKSEGGNSPEALSKIVAPTTENQSEGNGSSTDVNLQVDGSFDSKSSGGSDSGTGPK